jgi:HD-GYP domain-containing protein (c-di-GMP phosphodiesterase class II)
MHLNVSVFITIFATILYGVIFALVLSSKPRTRLKEIFALYLLAMSLWSVSAFLVLSGLVYVLPWFKVMTTSPLTMMLAMFFFIQTMFGFRRKWAPLAIFYGILVVLITLFTSIMVESASLDQAGGLQYELGPYFSVVAVPGYSLILVCLSDLIRGYTKTHDAQQRDRIRYLSIGFSITVLAAFTNFTPIGKYPIDIAANGMTALLIAYTILRHQLLDIRVAIRVGLLYSITTAFFSAIYFLTISLMLNAFQLLSGKTVFIVSIFVGTLSAILLNPLRNQVQSWIDRIFYRDKYNAELMLQRLSQTTTSLLDIDKITHLILSEISNTLHIEHCAILIKSMKRGDFQVIAEDENVTHFRSGFRADHPIVTWMSRHEQPLLIRDLSLFPIFKSMWKEENEELEKFNAEIFLPLNSKGELIGILVLGRKLSSEPYTRDEQLLFSTLANQTAVAIENARLYEELRGSFVQTVIALANAIDVRDTYTNMHSQQIANWAAKTARQLGCTPEEINEIYLGGLLHDIGKIGIPDAILQKPSKLNDAEWEIVHTHPTLGAELISPIKKLANVSPMIESSHERYDGLGYPHGIKGVEIPLGARIISVVDSYSAMLDKRPYKEPYSMDKIIEELQRFSGKMYDPLVVEAFLKICQEEAEVKQEAAKEVEIEAGKEPEAEKKGEVRVEEKEIIP